MHYDDDSAASASRADEEELPLNFIPIERMPSSRLEDIFLTIKTRPIASISLDALVPSGDIGCQVLQTLLHSLKPHVKTLSLRFLNFNAEALEWFIEWLTDNKHLEVLYLMGTAGIDDKGKARVKDAWSKNLFSPRTDKQGFTFIRIPEMPPEDEEDD